MVAPDLVKTPLMVLGGLMIVLMAFTSVELTLYLLIFSTLLSPEITFGGGSEAEIARGVIDTTESRGVTLRLEDIILTLVCMTWLFRMAVIKELGMLRKTPLNQPIALYWIVTLISTMLGFFAGRVGLYGFFFVIKYLEYFVLFFMIINHLHDQDTIKRYLIIMIATCVIASIVGIMQIPSGQRVSAPFEGELGEPNTFGGYLVLMFSVVLGIFLHTVKSRRWYILLVIMGVILIPLAFTESRSSYLSLMVSITLFVFISKNKRLLITACLAGAIMLPFVLPQNVIDRVMFTFNQTDQEGQLHLGGVKIDTSTTVRLESWNIAVTKYFPQHPALGVGVTGGPFLDAQYPRILVETGMLGLLLFLWLLKRIWDVLRQGYEEIENVSLRGASLGALCGFAGLLVHAIGTNTFIIVRIMEPFMILIGLLSVALIMQREKEAEKEEENQQYNLQSVEGSQVLSQ